ncbi:hypothetical protein J2T02_004807 [Chitinophaga terrae (ex Kim and Jung 2007)]|uniref:DUF5977 domain-containing protein n=1 Tax=Chitinophaga terrae (ex Kim and Jung 2007) TaxID=408074 RepID=UPI0027892297|nr:DUF5977 domain-containing protein [Chitinophaga terrae (ex Kim and Jung 2007)]MDQ0109663.1 hypothetical protein [Chitinophaga terrae (ex Kim and Jung 2007)]
MSLKKCKPLSVFLLLFFSIAKAQVDLPTGKATFSLPLFNYDDGERLKTTISLNYSGGGGIKVNETPGIVGLGWELLVGGSIVRATVGEPDDQIGGTYGGVRYADGYLYSPYNMAAGIPAKAAWIPLGTSQINSYRPDSSVIADRELDMFVFRFGNRSGSFTLTKDGYIFPGANSMLSIEKTEKDQRSANIITRINGFIITDEKGIKYKFSAIETSNIVTYEKGSQVTTSSGQTLIYQNKNISPYSVVTAWHLSEIFDPFTGHTITFNYSDYPLSYVTGYEGIYTVMTSPPDYKQDFSTQSIQHWYSGTKKRLQNISISASNTSVDFTYYDAQADMPGEKPLKQILIKSKGQTASGYLFKYRYFSREKYRDFDYVFPAADLPDARLALWSVQKTGQFTSMEPPYLFDYYHDKNLSGVASYVPPRTWAAQDHFGYFNGSTLYDYYSNDNTTFNNARGLSSENQRNVNGNGEAVLGTLKQVTYPTGGRLNFEYQINNEKYGASVVNTGGVRVGRTILTDMLDSNKKVIREYRYVREDSTISAWGYEPPLYKDTVVTTSIIPFGTSRYYAANMAYNVGMAAAPIAINAYANSLSFAQISGQLSFNIFAAMAITIISNLFQPSSSPTTPRSDSITNAYQLSNHPSKNNLLPHMYQRVEVLEGSGSSNIGKTIYEFTSPSDFALAVPVLSAPYSDRTRCLPWMYGLLKRKLELDKNNRPVSELINTYKFTQRALNPTSQYSARYKATKMLMCFENSFAPNAASRTKIISDGYYPLAGNAELTSTVMKDYDSTGLVTQTTKTYVNDVNYYYPKTITSVNSIGDTIQERYYYAADYGSSLAALNRLKDAGAISTLVSRETWQLKPGAQFLLDATISDFKPQITGNINVEQQFQLQTSAPLPASAAGNFNPAVLNRLPSLNIRQQAITYDDSGRVVTIVSQAGPKQSYKWGYNGERVVAVVQNANAARQDKVNASPGAATSGTITANVGETKSVTFTLSQPGTVYIKLEVLSPESRYCHYTLTGGSPAITKSGYLCKVLSPGTLNETWDNRKSTYPVSIIFGNLKAGIYTLTTDQFAVSPTTSANPNRVYYSYYTDQTNTVAAEFYYESFEDSSYLSVGKPFIGQRFKPGDFTVPFTIPNSRSYRIDYWYRTGTQWTYIAKPYTNGMTLTEGDAIDEVRVYPTDAVIGTYTYLPSGNISSESDQNGRVKFYEYDGMSRLSIVRDQYGNILKRICYNYYGQPETCGGGSYSNVAVTQVFTKQGCGIGFTPSSVPYTVPAGTYVADDQETANNLAYGDVQTNGQNYANQNGQCQCLGEDRAVINGRCEKGFKETFVDYVDGGTQCREGYWYRFSDGSHSIKYYGRYVACP